MTKTPLPPGGDADRVYHRRGWCHLERRLGDLEAPASNSLDVAAWPTAEAERAARVELVLRKITATEAQRGPPQLRESEEELAAQADHHGKRWSRTAHEGEKLLNWRYVERLDPKVTSHPDTPIPPPTPTTGTRL